MPNVEMECVGVPTALLANDGIRRPGCLQRHCTAFAEAVAAVQRGVVAASLEQGSESTHEPGAGNEGEPVLGEERGSWKQWTRRGAYATTQVSAEGLDGRLVGQMDVHAMALDVCF